MPNDVTVELYISGAWVDITADVEADSVSITRGSGSESGAPRPGSASLTLLDPTGKYSSRNPGSIYYGLLGANTPLRITMAPAGGDPSVRFVGEVASWPTRWNKPGTVVHVDVEAAGLLRRAGQGKSPLASPMRRNLPRYNLVGYWPFEDGREATTAANAVPGGQVARVSQVSFGEVDGPLGSSAVLKLTAATSRIAARVTEGSATEWVVQVAVKLNATPASTTDLLTWRTSDGSTWILRATTTLYALRVEAPDGSTRIYNGMATFTDIPATSWVLLTVWASITGSTVSVFGNTFLMDNGLDTYVGQMVSTDIQTWSSTKLGYVRDWTIATSTANLVDAAFGHVAVISGRPDFIDGTTQYPTADGNQYLAAFNGYRDEKAADRIARLCAEQGLDVVIVGDAADSQPMGTQLPARFLDLLTEAANTDGGILGEDRTSLALSYRVRRDLLNQTPVTLDYSAGHLSGELRPVDDDQAIRNDVTVTRPEGSSARKVQLTGPRNVQDPTADPQGVGVYEDSVDANVADDAQLDDIAGWHLSLGTLDQPRYPQVEVNLTRQPLTGTTLADDLAALDIGDRLDITELPSFLPPGDARVIVRGYTETLGRYDWKWKANASPYELHDAAVYEDSGTRYDSPDSVLSSGVTSSATSLVVTSASGVRWTPTGARYPIDVQIGGEVIRLNNAPGATLPQTFTGVTRSVNGVVKAHSAGAQMRLAHPKYYAL